MSDLIVMVTITDCPTELFRIKSDVSEDQVQKHLEDTMDFNADRGDTFSIHDPFTLQIA